MTTLNPIQIMERAKEETKKVRTEVKRQTFNYIVTALGLVVGLAWNDAIKALIQHFFPSGNSSIIGQFIYALLLTILVVVVTMYVVRRLQGSNNNEDKK